MITSVITGTALGWAIRSRAPCAVRTAASRERVRARYWRRIAVGIGRAESSSTTFFGVVTSVSHRSLNVVVVTGVDVFEALLGDV